MAYAKKYDTPEKRRTYDREAKALYRELRGIGLKGKPFIGIDGEGGDDTEGHHQYYLLTAGEWKIATGKPLTPQECLGFIAALPPDVYYVGYFFDYDVTMILRGLPPEKIARLFDREARTQIIGGEGREYTYPVDWAGYQIDYLPHKEFKVRRFTGTLDHKGKKVFTPWVVINDVGTFFQTSFVKALDQWDIGTPEQRADIATGKDMRADFGQLTEDTIKYNALEIVLLQELMESFRDVCVDIGYVPARWQGPGNLATAMLRHHGAPKNKDLNVPTHVIEAAGLAYYGGRFETTVVGSVTHDVYAYDINSAYPDALTHLPCLIHGVWETINTPSTWWGPMPGDLYLAHGTYAPNPADPCEYPGLYNFAHRDKDGHIFYPTEGSGWYWSCEIEQSAHQIFTPDIIYMYRKTCECAPFDWVPAIYDMRIALGKTKKGGVLKLGLNSIYGKMAQSIGAAPYANPVWAGLITALTRAKLMSISHAPDIEGMDMFGTVGCLCNTVLMLATDAVFTTNMLHQTATGKAGLQLFKASKKLGDWDVAKHDSLHIIQPGLYFTSIGMPPKTRGVPRQKIIDQEQDFRKVFSRLSMAEITVDDAYVMVPLRQFIGLRIANHRGRLDLAGEWLWCGENGEGKKISYQWKNKRNQRHLVGSDQYSKLEPHPSTGIHPDRPILTMPYHMNVGESVGYSKDIGKMLTDRKLDEDYGGTLPDSPDWADTLKDEDM